MGSRRAEARVNDLILKGMPLEVSGFSEIEIDQITMDEEPDAAEDGPLEPDPALEAIAQPGDLFAVGRHRIACGDARDPALLARLMASAEARLVLTDVPYNVPIKGHVSGGNHREFAMASGEMSSDEFLAFNQAWIEQAGRHLVEGGVIGTFIDWRGYPAVHAAATAVGLTPLNLVVWSKSNAGMGSLYRSAHELLPLFKKGKAAHVNNVELGRHGRWRSNVWTYPGASSIGSDAQQGLRLHPTVKPVAMIEDALLDLTRRGDIVLDPFLGSGSTVIAAEKSDRACYGVRLTPCMSTLCYVASKQSPAPRPCVWTLKRSGARLQRPLVIARSPCGAIAGRGAGIAFRPTNFHAVVVCDGKGFAIAGDGKTLELLKHIAAGRLEVGPHVANEALLHHWDRGLRRGGASPAVENK